MTIDREYEFVKDGFVILRKVFNETELSSIRSTLQRIVSYAEKGLEDPFDKYYLRHRADQGVLYDLFQRHPEFDRMARNERILDAVAEAAGPDIFLYENSVVYKPKGKQNGVPFHQDFISRVNEPVKYIAWMAVDRVTRDSGALKVVPGSHKKGFLSWHRIKGETHHDRINENALDLTGLMHVELEPGDVLIFNQLVVHGSDTMNTDSLRLVYRVSYQGFDEVFVPRGSPVVVRGGSPESMEARFPKRFAQPKPAAFWRRAARAIGRRLSKV